jgi:hypothetical protein
VLGNRSYLQGEVDIVQDPFIIYYIPANNYCVVMSTEDTSAQEHTFRIYQDNLQKLDEKYLSIINNPNSLEELFSEVLLFRYNDYFNAYCHTINYALFNIVDQQSYTIEWEDKQYQRTSFAFTAADGASCVGIGNTLVSGGENNGDEFAIVHDYTNNLLHFLSLDEDAYHKVKVYKNVQATIKSEYLPSMPHFNLYEMGLGDPVGHHNSMSLIEGNATEIITALEKGPVKFSFMYNGDLKTCIMNGEYSVAMDVWFCRTLINNNVLFNLWFFGVTICCTYNELESVLPDIGTSDNGKVLTVKDGVWSAQDAPTSLPEITTQDEGKILSVKDGVWTKTDAPNSGAEQVQADWDETDVTSPAYIKNKPTISADGTTSVQPNYEQNDATQADYIKNRPFYVGDEVTTKVLPATTLPFDFSESDGVYAFYMQPTAEYTELWQSGWSKMILTWGETVYECEPKEVVGMKVIGNVDAMLGTGNTGEPFVMGILEPPAIPQRMMVIIDLESAPAGDGSFPTVLRNIAVSMVSREIHTIDPKFIADVSWDKISNKPFGDLAAGSAVVDETVTLGAAGAITPLTTINVSNMIVGAEYNIAIGDATFIGYCTQPDEGGILMVATNDFEIVISDAIGGMVCESIAGLTEGTAYHVKVTLASDEVLKIDAKYLPSGLPDSSASDSGKVLTVGDDGAVTWSEPVSGLPDITTDADEGKFLRVVGGVAQWVSLTDVSQEGA